MNPYSVLGLPSSASKEEARAAYRRLAQRYHPDREGGDEARFKEIKAAWEMIEAGWVAAPPTPPQQAYARPSSFTKPEDAWTRGYPSDQERYDPFKHYKPFKSPYTKRPQQQTWTQPRQNVVQAWSASEPEIRKNLGDFIARVSMAEAFNGFICQIEHDGRRIQVKMPNGIPHKLRNVIKLEDSKEEVTIITLFNQNAFNFVGVDNCKSEITMVNSTPCLVHRTKDLSIRVDIPRRELDRGTTLQLDDFLGAKMYVKVPAGHDIRKPIIVSGHGYVDWYSAFSQCSEKRGDVLIYLNPTEKVEMSHLNQW